MDQIINSFLAVPEVHAVYYGVMGFVIVLDIAFALVTVFAIIKLLPYRPHIVWRPDHWEKHVKARKSPAVKTPVVTAAWQKVERRMHDASPETLRLAVIEADGVVDEVLKRMGLSGETFADRMSRLKADRYPSIERVWEAHRLRNNLVHTPDFHLAPAKAEQAIAAYQSFLKEVKAL